MRRNRLFPSVLPWCLSVLAVACGGGGGAGDDVADPVETTGEVEPGTGSSGGSGTGTGTGTGTEGGTDSVGCEVEALALPGDGFFPEGVAAADGQLFVGSLATGAIVGIDVCTGDVDELSPPGDPIRNAVGLRVDEERDLLWVCNSDVQYMAPPSIDALDLVTGERVAEHPFADIGFCNDIALDDAGNVYATDSAGHQIHRVAAGDALSDTTTESWLFEEAFVVEPGEFGLNGIAFDPAGALWVSNYQLGELYRVPIEADGSAGAFELAALDDALPTPDGVLWHDGGLLVVSGGDSLASLELSDPVSVTPLADGLDFGTTVAVDDGVAWVAEGQLDHLFGIDPAPPNVPFVVVPVEL